MPNLFRHVLKLFNNLFLLIFINLFVKGWDCRALEVMRNFYAFVEKKAPPYAPFGRLWRGYAKVVLFSIVIIINQKYTKL